MGLPSCVLWWLVLLQPLRCSTVDYLFSEPHQADKRTQGAGDNKAALQAICQQVLSAKAQKSTRAFVERENESSEILLEHQLPTHVESMSRGSVKRELTEPVNRHL